MTDPTSPDGDFALIDGYSRAEAIEDGVLIDATAGDLAAATALYFKVPVAMTVVVFEALAAGPPGRWEEVAEALATAIARRPPESSEPDLLFGLPVGSHYWDLKAVMGPDDQGNPCLTLMLPDED
jgi:hypothetical protein